MLNGHGDDIYSYNRKIVSNFSSNIYNRQNLSALKSHLSSCLDLIQSYPEPDAHSLAVLIGEKHNIDTNNICVTNGATEAIYLIAQAFSEKRSGIITPTFSEYEDACRIHKHRLSFSASLNDISQNSELIWLCNPNNPTGSAYNKQYLENFIMEHSNIYFVIDQSYAGFTNKEYVFTAKEASKHKNIILLHSLTKEYAIAGLRLGYITAHNELIKKAKAYRMPWSVNALAVEAGKFLLSGDKKYFDLNSYLAETNRLMTGLNNIEGLMVLPTNTHFFLCELIKKKASDLKQYLIDKHGILIRDAANFRGLDEHFFRVATQSPQENDILIKAIKEWM